MKFVLKLISLTAVLASLALLLNSAINWIYYETTGKYVTFDGDSEKETY